LSILHPPSRSAAQLVDSGIPWVILGHSERRTLFHETSEVVADKTKAAIDAGLSSCRLSFRFCGMDFDT
jgi:triosephosphate isomerase